MVKKAGKKTSKKSQSTIIAERNDLLKSKSAETKKRPTRSRSRVSGNEDDDSVLSKKLKPKQKKNVEKDDPKKPKKPPTAFFYFLEDFRKEYQSQNPDVKSMRDVGKACGEKWNTMRYEEKFKYFDLATEKRAEFEDAKKEYERKKASGEYEEDDENLEEEDAEFEIYN